jgi:hypothetical protein
MAPSTKSHKTGPVVAAAVAYAVAGLVAVSLDSPAKGYAILATSLGGVIGVVWLAKAQHRFGWLAALSVIIPISIFQVFPDWFLADTLGTLVFPDNGGIRIGGVIPLAMAGLWVLPLLFTTRLAKDSLWKGAIIAAAIFLGTEILAPGIKLWEPGEGLHEILGVAIYVIPAEAALGAATVYAVRVAGTSNWPTRITAAAAVSIFYTGALALSAFLIESASFRITF